MDLMGLLYSFSFVGVVLIVGLFLAKKTHLSGVTVRKIVHIGVANWWFFLITFFDSIYWAAFGPLLFIFVNIGVIVFGLDSLFGIKEERRNLGLIYFPVSLFLLVILGFTNILPLWACSMGAMSMGYGDGLAALIGRKYGKMRVTEEKTLVGMITMGVVTLLVLIGFSALYRLPTLFSGRWILGVILTAIISALLEAFTPFGLDNITVPLGSAWVSFWILGGV